MKKQIRASVFETNSSSSHSISIASGEQVGVYDTIVPNADGEIVLTGGHFGWEWVKCNDAIIKANYAAVDNPNRNAERQGMLEEVLKEHTGAKEIVFALGDSYIDHQSVGTSHDAFASKQTLKDFIFSPNSWLFTGNDNDYPPANFYDVGDIDYKYQLSVEGSREVVKFPEEPSQEDLKECLQQQAEKSERARNYYGTEFFHFYNYDNIDSLERFDDGIVTLFNVDYRRTPRVVKAKRELKFKLEKI